MHRHVGLMLLWLVLLLLLIHVWMVWRRKVLSRHHLYRLLPVQSHANRHVELVDGLLPVLLDFCSTVLEPVLRSISYLGL